ncbi:HD domain-containing protein [Marinobacterium sediminicola]|uniref:HD domain-containing protein n=1 Tax=Marinobacterium sediminicola TaxID=518898 RepID=A0ABY1RWA1_9GAMM|nr:HD domain-containing protein [Marinobacterium sediminicola]ULG70388.1 HD domain-containing protein [Marinobacterium sediminicola]SMR69518.1 HD domain-containing protein [Marinobacterium sediminicola]
MSVWDQDTYQRAWNFASNIHHGQKLPGSDIPYINHLGLVAMEAAAAVAHERIENPDILVLCALLHDAIEDTSATYEEIKHHFGTEIADGVLALTKNENLSSKHEQMMDSIGRIKYQPKEVWMVKLCDRITNLQPPPAHWDQVKIAAYQSEARLILEQLGEASPFLSKRLQAKIANYDQYL